MKAVFNPFILKEEAIKKAAKLIKVGRILAYPTETFYGLAVNALDEEAVKRLFKIKKRPVNRPISIIIPDISWLRRLTKGEAFAKELIEKCWPGPLTIVFKASDILPKNLIAKTDKIGIRISSHPLAQRLTQLANVPITATSANLSDTPPPTSLEEVSLEIKKNIYAILDGGPTKGGLPSTVIDVTVRPPLVLRKGVIRL